MRKSLTVICFLILVSVSAAAAQDGPKFGVGTSFGLTYPIFQDDQNSGTSFEFRGRWALASFAVLEPTLALTSYGSPDPVAVEGHQDFDFAIDGSKITAYGLDVTLGGMPGVRGLKPMFIVGLGFYKTGNDDTENVQESETKIGMSGGLGLAFGVSPRFDIDARGKAHVITADGDTSKKSVTIVFGVNYNFGGE